MNILVRLFLFLITGLKEKNTTKYFLVMLQKKEKDKTISKA